VCRTLGRLDHFAALLSQQLGQQSALGLAVLDPLDLADRLALSQISGLRSFQCRCQCVSQRQSYGDDDYSEGDELDQIIWPFSVGESIAEETRSSHAQRVGSFHIYNTPFTNEMTIFMQQNGQLFGWARCIAKVTLLSLWRTHDRTSPALL
jgi:hypothetical protein